MNFKLCGNGFVILISFGIINSTLFAQENPIVIPLWKTGAPGFESLKTQPEQAKDWWVNTINNPSVTVFPAPKNISNGTSVVICPGGGFQNLVFNAEGTEAAEYFNKIGVTAFVLKYRLFRQTNSPYTQEHPKQDIFRAMRLVRSVAKNYDLDTSRIGVMGFSAGGEVAGWVSYHFEENNFVTPDEVDFLTARPAFQILIYPGPLAVPDSINSHAPTTFLLASNNDDCCSDPIIKLLQMHRKAKIPVEVHLLSVGSHAFNMGNRSEFVSIKTWPQRMADWLNDNGLLKNK